MTTYTIEATPLRSGGWALEVEGVGVSQVRRLDQAVDEMRDAVADITGLATSEFDLVVAPQLESDLESALAELVRRSDEATRAQEEAARQRRATARALADRRLTGRDIAQLMGVSTQRVSQLLREAS